MSPWKPQPLLLLLLVSLTAAQVPRVCVHNVTEANSGTCCPPDPANPGAGPCGGAARGRCAAVQVYINGTRASVSSPLPETSDVRLDWPARLFRNVCSCNFFYSGYACQHALGGVEGQGWRVFLPWLRENVTRVRKNAEELTPAERQRFVAVMRAAKEEVSDYVVLDQISGGSVSYFNVSVYDFFVFLNYFATNGVDLAPLASADEDEMVVEAVEWPDFAHRNPHFVPFFRTLLARFETELDVLWRKMNVSGPTTPFALPYWDWSNKSGCAVCQDSLVGALNASDPENRLSSGSPFAQWTALCQNTSTGRHPCDPSVQRPFITRGFSTDPLYQALPSTEEVAFVMNASNYDSAPYNEFADNTSFRNLLEGFVGEENNKTAVAMGKRYMGMQVLNYLNGTWTDPGLGANDPLFWLHYAYMDRLYNQWMQKNKKSPGFDLPKNATVPKGTSREDNIVGFIPVEPAFKAKKFSTRSFGYSYAETTEKSVALSVDDGSDSGSSGSVSTVVWAVVGCVVLIICVAFFIRYRRRETLYRYVESISFEEIDCNEKTHLLRQDSKQPC